MQELKSSQTAVATRTVGSCFHSFSRLHNVETLSCVSQIKRGSWPMRMLQLAKYRLKPNERLANHWFQFTASQDRKNINAVLVAVCFTFWWTMAAGSFMPVVFCILFISCWLVQTESFNSNHVGKRTVKVNIWIFYVQVSLNVRRASLCSSLK